MSLEETAHHEAAHSVVAYRRGLQTGTVTIVPVDDVAGSSVSEGVWMDLSRDDDAIVVLFAGAAAKEKLNPGHGDEGAWSDYERADELLNVEMIEGRAEREKRLKTEARAMVEADWTSIKAVASALLEFKTLHGDESTIIIDAIDEGQDWRPLLAQYLATRPLRGVAGD